MGAGRVWVPRAEGVKAKIALSYNAGAKIALSCNLSSHIPTEAKWLALGWRQLLASKH